MLKITPFIFAISTLFTACIAQAENVEIYLTDMLDNIQSGYCIDIARAQGARANPEDGLQAHTCYSAKGELMVDQIFDTDKFADGILYMPEFDVCVTASSLDAGSSIGLEACDGSAAQSFQFSGEGMIVPASAQNLCVTAEGDTRTGRSKENQMKPLTLETCTDDKAASQVWAVRGSL